MDSLLPFLPDHPYVQAIEAIQKGITSTGEETL